MKLTKQKLINLIEEELTNESWLDKFYISKKRAAELDQERELDLPPARKFAKDSVQTSWYGDYGSEKEGSKGEIEDAAEEPAEKEKTSKIKDSHPLSHWVSFVEEVNDMYQGPQGGALDGKIKKKKNITKFKSAEDKKRSRAQKEIIKRLDILKRNLRPGAWAPQSTFRDSAIDGAKQRLVNDILRNLRFLSGSYGENTSPDVIKKDVDDLANALENNKISLKIVDDTRAMVTEGNIKMKLTKQKLINLIKEEIGKVTEKIGKQEEIHEEAEDFIVQSIHEMLRQVEDMGLSPKWGGKHYEDAKNVILDAIDSYVHPDKESWPEPGFSDDE